MFYKHSNYHAHINNLNACAAGGFDVNEEAARSHDNESKELFDSFRVFCNRKSVSSTTLRCPHFHHSAIY